MIRRAAIPRSDQPDPGLGRYLKSLRSRIDRYARALGPYVRLPRQRGKLVTQNELAEAIGVSREWYGELESAAPPRMSTSLVSRLADALMVTQEERARLFHLALPELGRVHLRDDSIAAFEAFSRLRSFSKRLWAATSIDDVVTTASEQIAEWFDGALVVGAGSPCESGLWDCRSVDDKQDRTAAARVFEEVKDLLATPQLHAVIHLTAELANAGDVGTPDLWPPPIQHEMVKACERRHVAGFAGLYGRVRSRSGFIGGFYTVYEFGHSYSPSDLAVLGLFADLASFALS
jgi:transcriptional regulator with XRE-family HTH domain